MKRLHIHVAVTDLEKSVAFYSAFFGVAPTKQKSDYAKWMLDDPRVNFAISARGAQPGLDHLGIQTETPEELQSLRDQLARNGLAAVNEGETTCCYANSDKSWLTDPNGVAWEAYHTMGDAVLFNHGEATVGACCAPPESDLVQICASAPAPR